MTPFYLIVFLIPTYECAKIVGYFPTPSHSHQIVFKPLMLELSKRGHEITLISPDPIKSMVNGSGFKQIDLHDMSYEIMGKLHKNIFKANPLDLHNTIFELFDAQLSSPQVQSFLNDETLEFDLCIVECLAIPMYSLKHKFNCPLITMCSLPPSVHHHEGVGNPTNPIYYMGNFETADRELTFFQRLKTFFIFVYHRFYIMETYFEKYDKLIKETFGENSRTSKELLTDVDLMFVGVHQILSGIRPTNPSVIHMGGMHIQKNNPLPKELKDLLDFSEKGVIYFSLGSNVKSKHMSPENRKILLDTFSELPHTVIWKWENDTLDEKPKNVHTFKWLPQQDLLAHPNVKAFITQGGMQSLEEAIFHKIPVMAIPVFADQNSNANKVLKLEIGVSIQLEDLTKDSFKNTLMEVLTNEKYKENISRLKDIVYDEPQTNLEKAVWWTEYVLRHKGAKHFRPSTIGEPLYKYFLLDVVGFCLVIAMIIFKLSYIVYRALLKKRDTVSKKKNE